MSDLFCENGELQHTLEEQTHQLKTQSVSYKDLLKKKLLMEKIIGGLQYKLQSLDCKTSSGGSNSSTNDNVKNQYDDDCTV